MATKTNPPAPDPSPALAGDDRKVKWPIKLLVGFHIVCITVWTLPVPAPDVQRGEREPSGREMLVFWNAKYGKSQTPIINYLLFSGAWQYWDMFAPDPINYDIYGSALITYRDGSTRNYTYPRIKDEGYLQKYIDERYRKFFERAKSEEFPQLWPPFAQRIALINASDSKNPPIRVQLIRNIMLIAPPGKPQATTYSATPYFTYSIDQKKLARDKGWAKP